MAHLIGKLCVGVKDTTQAFVPAGISFVGASVVVAVWNATDRFPSGWWLVGFLALVGGVAQLLLGAGRKAIVRTAPSVTPRWWHISGQALLWNVGTVLVAFGILAPTRMAVATGSVLLVSALGALALELRDARDATSVRARATPWPHGRAPTPAQVQREVGTPAIADSGGGSRRPTAHGSPPSSPAIEARRRRMQAAGFAPDVAARYAADFGLDVPAVVELTDRGCPPQLVARILAPLDDDFGSG